MATNLPPKSDDAIDIQMIRHIAYLVRLGIVEDEARAFSHQFSEIIEHFRLLNEVDTQDVPPACEVSTTHSLMRADEIRPSMPRQDFMKNVPHKSDDYVQVPKVFEEP